MKLDFRVSLMPITQFDSFRSKRFRWFFAALLACLPIAQGAVTGRITGTVKDASGGAIPGAMVTATNTEQNTQTKTTTDAKGDYAFPSLPVGNYEVQCESRGFRTEKRIGLVIDANAAIQLDLTLELAQRTEEVTVSDTADQIHVETVSTQLGDVVTGKQMTTVALNGRSFTDLLALQPGIVPTTTQEPESIVMAGASVAIQPSGTLNPGNQSISGQREDSNGFLVNGGDVKELMNGGTSVVPNLDSIAEFRILTNSFDAEYGNYAGGVVNVITKSGSNQLHGSGFEFLRNTALDARNFFSPERSFYRQNQFGGTVGGPIKENKLFFFGDYQGTRQSQGIDTGLIAVPTLANRNGNLADDASSLTGEVGGKFLADLLTDKLGYPVVANERYYTPGCNSPVQCVFPNAMIPKQAWSDPAKHLLQYIPLPNAGDSSFSTGAVGKILHDNKGSGRVDVNSDRWGALSAYYYLDNYNLNNPYPTGQGGANVPGFSAINAGRSQLINLSQTKTFGATAVNEVRLSFMRSFNNVGKPVGGVGPSLASQGFVTGPGTPGIVALAPDIEGIENVTLNAITFGTPITNLTQANNTYSATDNFSKVLGAHTMKTGFQMSYEQVNVNPNPTFNGAFTFYGTETGSDIADFLIGVSTFYNQADSQTYYARHKYASAFYQDSWRATSSLTLNFGLRWDLMQYWSEKYNQIPTFNLRQQSKVFPDAPRGLVYPTDEGVPNTLVPQGNRFAPRFGIAYSPTKAGGLLGKIIGGPGKTSVRAGFGMFYTVIQGNTIAIDEPQPPYGLSYTGNGTLFDRPFITASDGSVHPQPFPMTFPPLNTTASNPTKGIDFSPFLPQAGMTTPYRGNTYPYNENYFFSVERQLGMNTLASVSYVGSQAHHLLMIYSANPGDPALCLALSKPSAVKPGTITCGPGGEDNTYITADNRTINGTRGPFGPNFSNDDFEGSFGNSSYNSLQASVRHSAKGLDLVLAYTYSKSIDQASSISDVVDPFNYKRTRALSAWDLTHNLVATYSYQFPFERFSSHMKPLTRGWQISGITRISSGFPVTISSDVDTSLQGSSPNGVNNHLIDLPDYTPGNLNLNGNPRNGLPYFNTDLFTTAVLGTPGSASRRTIHGPGMVNFDISLMKSFKFTESKTLQFRWETFNTFNHAQFFGPSSVAGDFDNSLFGQVVKAAPPRLMQLALKFTF
ncbi:MAG: carboxypeptidase regulatory-like domain-containing protein [Acidobacteriia bacterium]|nr:carboxypeptidase regulatory-like domain-containing protein [Terriglobia bacterium]